MLTIDVRGLPRPQGSMRVFPNGGVAYPPAVIMWRRLVQGAAVEAMMGKPIFLGAVELRMGFDLPRPASHYGTGRNVTTVKASAPPWPITMPDLDKLVRAVGDALTDAGVWKDDSQVVSLTTAKRYGDRPGVLIQVKELE